MAGSANLSVGGRVSILLLLSSTMLWSMPPGGSMEKEKEYDDTIGCIMIQSSKC